MAFVLLWLELSGVPQTFMQFLLLEGVSKLLIILETSKVNKCTEVVICLCCFCLAEINVKASRFFFTV